MSHCSLRLVTVPIGNLADITLRTKETLEKEVLFAVEDTRVFASLLEALQISKEGKTIYSFHDYSDKKRHKFLLDKLKEKGRLCIVSDRGGPLFSDPAYPLVKLCVENGIAIETSPGVSSLLVALEVSGLPPIPFHFHGFSPRKKGDLIGTLEGVMGLKGTHVFFESVHRVENFLECIAKVNSQSQVVVTRELTKKFESVYRFQAGDYEKVLSEIPLKGEFVILFYVEESAPQVHQQKSKVLALCQSVIEKRGSKKSVAKLVANLLGQDSKEIYTQLGDH